MIIKPLSSIAKNISSGLTPLRSNPLFWVNPTVPWLKTEQLGNKYIFDTKEYISEEAVKKNNMKIFPKNTLSIAMYGEGKTRGNLSILKTEMATNQACCNIEIDPEYADFEYVYYFLKTQYQNIRNLSSGIRKNLNSNDIKNYLIYLPDSKQEQIKISSVLMLIDQKIELNNRINTELEAMAKTLYDYWFVQFDFPNEEGKPYKSSGGKMVYNSTLKREIPEGWLFKRLSSLTNIITETIIPEKSASKIFKYFSIPQFDENKIYKIEYGCNIKSNKFRVTENDLLVSKLNPWFNRVVYPMAAEDQICSTEFVVLRTDNFESKSFLYCITTSKPFIDYCSQSSTGTSNSHKRIDPNLIIDYAIPFQQQTIEKFSNISNPIIRKIIKNYYENARLASLRDFLLPMLMNGQVTVK
ncbi:restriction endonuclease subunit S [Snodgrassella sp. ESL0304]|uniref:restriction endonuclease subunit S n=1 Tax=Snodgrassella sp. ESL0304 TaxID=2705032 RepID=UPI0015837E19|nr:restriction endonuclease subunit S [Snodgrassella sp. ESL0304]NUE81256.1 restriction endonuclease subunit S [Snodgrassella sp. ESL0304]